MTRNRLVTLFERAAAQVAGHRVGQVDEGTEICTLGLDSLSMFELVGELERELGVRLSDDRLVGLRTVRDLLDLLVAAPAGRPA